MTEITTREQLWQLARELAAEVEAEAQARREEEARQRASQVGATDRELALQVLMFDGMDELEARRTLDSPLKLDEMRDRIESRRATLQQQADEQKRREFEASPEGRRLAAAAALEAEQALAANAELSRALLRSNPEAAGIAAEMVAELSNAEAIKIAGLVERQPDPFYDGANDLAANRRAADPDQQ